MKIRNKISILRFIAQLSYLCLFVAGVLSKNYVFLFINISAILLGPIFCGWMCFVGFYQDVLRYLGRFIKKEPFEIDEKIHRFLKYSRYVFFAGAIAFGGLFLFPGNVWHKFSLLIKGNSSLDAALYFIIILGIFSLFTKRFFCRYFCTFGARLGLSSLLRPITINRDESCISCKLCSSECPMHINVDKINSLMDPSCINCLKCVECCPKNSLKINFRNYLKP
jgi:polyferredoxin